MEHGQFIAFATARLAYFVVPMMPVSLIWVHFNAIRVGLLREVLLIL